MAVPPAHRTFVLTLLAACSFESEYGTGYRCGAGDTCPTGLECIEGRCTVVGDDDPDDAANQRDAAVDAGDLADAATPRFSDEFDDGSLDGWAAWDYPGCDVVETGGALLLDFDGGLDSYCGADTTTSFDLRTGAVMIELADAPELATFETYAILFTEGSSQQILIALENGDLVMHLRIEDVNLALSTIEDPGDRHWRISNDGTTTRWETSATGTGWTLRHSTQVAVDASAMFVELAAGHYEEIASPVQVRYERVVVE
jgi:hypothetical protein